MKLIAVGALGSAAVGTLGSAAIMALPAGAANDMAADAARVTTRSTDPATATLTADTAPADPAPANPPTSGAANSWYSLLGSSPGGTATASPPGGTAASAESPGLTVQGMACLFLACGSETTSIGADGSKSVEVAAGIAAGDGVNVRVTNENPLPPGWYGGLELDGNVSTTVGRFTVGVNGTVKSDLISLFTGGTSGSELDVGVTAPGVATVGNWLTGNDQFQYANGAQLKITQNPDGGWLPNFSVIPQATAGEDISGSLMGWIQYSTAGAPSGTGDSQAGNSGSGAAINAPGPMGGLTFDQITYQPPVSAGFPDDTQAIASAPYQAAPPGTDFPSIQQMMALTPQPGQGPNGQPLWPDGTVAAPPSYGTPFQTAPVWPGEQSTQSAENNSDNGTVLSDNSNNGPVLSDNSGNNNTSAEPLQQTTALMPSDGGNEDSMSSAPDMSSMDYGTA